MELVRLHSAEKFRQALRGCVDVVPFDFRVWDIVVTQMVIAHDALTADLRAEKAALLDRVERLEQELKDYHDTKDGWTTSK